MNVKKRIYVIYDIPLNDNYEYMQIIYYIVNCFGNIICYIYLVILYSFENIN